MLARLAEVGRTFVATQSSNPRALTADGARDASPSRSSSGFERGQTSVLRSRRRGARAPSS